MWVVISSLCLLFFRHFRFNDVDVVRGNKRKRPQSTAGSPANSGQSSSRHSVNLRRRLASSIGEKVLVHLDSLAVAMEVGIS
ncbi:Lysis DeFective 2, no significant blast hit, conidia-enriched transcript [Histoplasma capsulatum var. duboisii H88]|uniref:Lysis DeFective 2, no significant blast hit, conidia-enriched transcript n=1 Tax=Ajellomyces capsulatus (strain H88) TaxID=544711 RepID=A0A8A1L4C6_AJEC8|nr:Lysis DeFective 2, no significant blast hit, conidia-enriched transcript [Histoplasma capsulatum var. duboisii H88]